MKKTFKMIFTLIVLGIVVIIMYNRINNLMENQNIQVNKNKKVKTKVSNKSIEGIGAIQTHNVANQTLQYYYFIPSSIQKNKNQIYPLLVCIPGLSGKGERLGKNPLFKNFAQEEQFIIIAPSFKWDKKNWPTRQSYQYPSAWSGKALIDIAYEIKKKNDIRIGKFYFFGFSAGAQFAIRFPIWRPDLCIASAGFGSGGRIEITEQISVKFFIGVGEQDLTRIPVAENFYNEASELGMDVTFRLYPQGHYLSKEQIQDSLHFFKTVKINTEE